MRNALMIHKKRRAVAMIELIFSIVVMGIAISAIPMLVNRSSQSIYTSLQQEAVAAATTQISTIMSAQWDNADTNTSEGGPVLRATSDKLTLCTGSVTQPAGVTSSSGRYCKGTQSGSYYTASTAFGTEGTTYEAAGHYDDIDDYNGQSYTIKIYNNETIETDIGDYIDTNISVTSNIYYGDDQPRNNDNTPSTGGYDRQIRFSNPFKTSSATTSNIKIITITLTSGNPDAELGSKSIRLSAFMCNIGSPDAEIVNNDPY